MLVKDLLKGHSVNLRSSKTNCYSETSEPIKWLAITDGSTFEGQESFVLSYHAALEASNTAEAVALCATYNAANGWGIICVPSFDECEEVTL